MKRIAALNAPVASAGATNAYVPLMAKGSFIKGKFLKGVTCTSDV